MPDPYHPLYSSIVRIRDATGEIVGAGFLAAPGLVCTCAHVVADAFINIPRESTQPPEGEVHLDFPFLGGAEVKAYIQVWVRMEPHDGGGDIALLRLTTDPPSAARPVRLLPASNLSGRAFEAYGFPSTTDVGQFAYGILRDRLANGYVQLEGTTAQGYRIQHGYSGTPVWDSRGRGIVGMVVAEEQNPEAKVAFLIPNNLIFQACSDIKPITLHQLFAPLTEGLSGLPGSPLSGVEQFLNVYLGTPDAPAPFGGRQVHLAALDRWLAAPGQPYALLVAEAGRGKSALLAHWVARVADERRAEVAFVPISIRFSTTLKSTTMNLLGARLRHLHDVRADLPRDTEGWLAEIEMYLREDRPVGDPPLLIVLDGADEAADWMVGRDLRFPPEPGRGIKVLVSARTLADCDAKGWVRRLEWQGVAVPMDLPGLDREEVAEVLRSMGDPLARLVTQVEAVSELHRLSEGDPLLVGLYVDALLGTGERAAFLTAEDLGHLKPGLEDYFDQWWDDQRHQWRATAVLKEPAVRTLLNLLACALGPLSKDDLLALMEPEQVDLWLLEEALRPLARFVVGDDKEQGYVFSHPRLNQYFYEKLPLRERKAWEQRFVSYGRQTVMALTGGERGPREVSSYIVRHYGPHLERADADPVYFDELVCEGWLQAWDVLEGTYDGFLSDLTRAWKRAEAYGAHAQSMQELGRVLYQQCRYALIVASITSLAENIPPGLLVALVAKGVWIPIQGLASAQRIANERQRVQALMGLAPHLSEPMLQEVLTAARAISNKHTRAEALACLVPRLAELGQGEEALAVARALPDEGSQAQALTGLAQRLSEPMLQEVLTAARAITAKYWRVKALTGLAPQLPEPMQTTVLQEALAAARAIADAQARAEVLTDFAQHLFAPLQTKVLQEALAAARAIDDEQTRAQALGDLARYLSAPLQTTALQEALAAARAIRVETLEDTEAEKDRALARLVPRFAELGQGEEALTTAGYIADGRIRARAEALARLVPRLTELGQSEEVLAVARAIADVRIRAEVLTDLAPHLSEPLLQEALAAARTIADGRIRAEALARLVSCLAELGQVEEALAVARAITDGYWRAAVLAGLAPQLSTPLLQEALAAARAIADEHSRGKALARLVPRFAELGQGEEALAVARAIADGYWRVKALTGLAPQLSEPVQVTVLQEALAVARAITDGYWRVAAFKDLASRLGELGYGEQALTAARAISNERTRAQVLGDLAPHLSAPLLQEALAAARSITNEDRQAEALVGLIPRLEELGNSEQALAAARAIADEQARAQALTALALHLSAPMQETVLQKALVAARSIADERTQSKALGDLASRLGELGYGEQALAAARAIADEQARAQALTALAPQLPEPLKAIVLQEALAAARSIHDDYRSNRAKVLTGLVPELKQLPIVSLYSLWCETLRILATRTRRDLLSDIQTLAPVIAVLGGKEALTATAQAIIEVGKWFP